MVIYMYDEIEKYFFYFSSNIYFDSYAAKFFEKKIHAEKTVDNEDKPLNKRHKYTITCWYFFVFFQCFPKQK
jgi:hypothetical protein